MDLTQQGNNSKQILLVGWKDIAVYLKCSVPQGATPRATGASGEPHSGTKSVWALKTAIGTLDDTTANAALILPPHTPKRFKRRVRFFQGSQSPTPQAKRFPTTCRLFIPSRVRFRRFILIYGPLCAVGILLGATTHPCFAAAYGYQSSLFLLTTSFVA